MSTPRGDLIIVATQGFSGEPLARVPLGLHRNWIPRPDLAEEAGQERGQGGDAAVAR
jgi:hypothetical protein